MSEQAFAEYVNSLPKPKLGICVPCGMSTDLTVANYIPRHRSWCHTVTDPHRTYEIEIVED